MSVRGRGSLTIALGLGLALALAAGPAAVAEQTPTPIARVAAELDAARRARGTIEERLGAREGDLATRVRALYKLTRAGLDPLWVDGQSRTDLVSRRAAARRMVLRDLEERRVLTRELAAATAAEARLGAELAALAPGAVARIGVRLLRPVAGGVRERHGRHLDEVGLERVREGVLYAAAPGASVVAPFAGRVLYVGPVRGQGDAVMIEHPDGIVVVVASLAEVTRAAGDAVERGAVVGRAAGPVYLQLRVAGRPVDPAPFLDQREP